MSTAHATVETAADLRADVARKLVPIYQLAPKVGLHPTHLGQILRGRRPLSPELARKIRVALNETASGEHCPHVVA